MNNDNLKGRTHDMPCNENVREMADKAKDLGNNGKECCGKGNDTHENMHDKGKEVLENVRDKGKEVFENVRDKGKDALDKGKNAFENVRDKVEDFVSEKTHGRGIAGIGD